MCSIDFSYVYKIFMALTPDEAGEYIANKSKENSISLIHFYRLLDDYTKLLLKGEKELYLKQKMAANFCQKKEVICITRYLSGKGDLNFLFSIGDINKINYYLTKYATIVPDKKQEIETLKQNVEKMYVKFRTGIETDYVTVMLKILSLDKEKVFGQLKLFNFSQDIYYIYLQHFIEMFPNELEKIKYLKELGDTYYSEEVKLENVPEKVCLIRNVLLSGLSIEEYCSLNRVSILGVTSEFNRPHSNYQIEVNEIKDILENRDKGEFYRKIKLSVYQFLNKKDFNMLDYYEVTLLGVEDYLKVCRTLIYDPKVMKRITDLLHIKMFRIGSTIVPDLFKEQTLSAKTIINGEEVSIEDKIKAFDYIEEKNYPIEIYSHVLNKILKESRQKVKV